MNRRHHARYRTICFAFIGGCLLWLIAGCAARPTPTPQPTLTPTPPATTVPQTPRYQIDPAASIIRYQATGALNLQLPGTFGVTGDAIILVPEGGAYRVKLDVVIDGTSVTAVNGLVRDALYNNLEVNKYPTARVVADSVELVTLTDGPIPFTASGTLTLHGVTRTIQLPIIMTISDGVLTANGETTLDLLDYAVNVPTAVMSSTITFKAEIRATEQVAEVTTAP
jgi:polyisoprenoid-binding protein YceI